MDFQQALAYLESERGKIEETLAGSVRNIRARNAKVALSLAAMDDTMHVLGINGVDGSASIKAWVVDAAHQWKSVREIKRG